MKLWKVNKYEELDKTDANFLLADVTRLREYEEKYDKQHEIEPLKVDDKYLKAMEDIYKMQEDFDTMFGEMPDTSSWDQQYREGSTDTDAHTGSLLQDIQSQFDDIDKIFSDLGLEKEPNTSSNPQDEF